MKLDNYSLVFPAMLTHKSGVDKLIVDLMPPLFDSALKPNAFRELIVAPFASIPARHYVVVCFQPAYPPRCAITKEMTTNVETDSLLLSSSPSIRQNPSTANPTLKAQTAQPGRQKK